MSKALSKKGAGEQGSRGAGEQERGEQENRRTGEQESRGKIQPDPPVKRRRGTSGTCPRCGSDLVVYRTQHTGHPHFCRRKRQYMRCMNARCDYRSSREK